MDQYIMDSTAKRADEPVIPVVRESPAPVAPPQAAGKFVRQGLLASLLLGYAQISQTGHLPSNYASGQDIELNGEGPVFGGQLAFAVSPSFAFGLHVGGGSTTAKDQKRGYEYDCSNLLFAPMLQLSSENWKFQGALGVSSLSQSREGVDIPLDGGVGAMFAGGYETWLSENILLSVMLQLQVMSGSYALSNGDNIDFTASTSGLVLGLSFASQ